MADRSERRLGSESAWQRQDRYQPDLVPPNVVPPDAVLPDAWPFGASMHSLALQADRPTRLRPSPEWERTTDPAVLAALARFGADVAKVCAERGLSQRGLAARSGVDQGTISRMMRGLAPGLRLEAVARIVVALDGHVTGSRSTWLPPDD